MPIILTTEPDKVRRLEIGDSWIEYTRASGDEVRRVVEDSRDALGRADMGAVAKTLMETHVVGWDGFACDNGDPLPFAKETVPVFVAALDYHLSLRLDSRITSAFVESADLGKD